MSLSCIFNCRSIRGFIVVSIFNTIVLSILLFVPFKEENVVSYSTYSTLYEVIEFGIMDITILNGLRILFMQLLMILTVIYKPIQQYKLKILYWPSYGLFLTTMAKGIVFDYKNDSLSTLFVIFSLWAACSELFLIGSAFKENRIAHPEAKEAVSAFPKQLSLTQLGTLLKSYFFPKGCLNKLRCLATFVFLAGSRGCNLLSPIFIGLAVDELSQDFPERNEVFKNVAIFAGLKLASSALQELQRVAYLKVGQIAFVEVSETTFRHLHSLSLDWHLKKKLGKVLRSLDRGISSINTVVRLLFLNLLPTFVELLAVFVIFYKQFNLPLLSSLLFVSIFCYGTVTYEITSWRKKYRRQTNKHDNDFHDKATDSLVNYETVKYFTREDFETKRYIESISKYQENQNMTIKTLALLNTTQNFIIQASLMGALFIVATEFLQNPNTLSVGDFVTAQVYMAQVFSPLSYLGSIYDGVIQAFVDISNLSELLANRPDIEDNKDSIKFNFDNKPVEVAFKSVSFVYPSNDASGLRNVSFTVGAGESLAIVGHTGAGKTTIGRLLFRFYDPIEGCVQLSGIDIRKYTQQSVREAIGVVPQDTVLFNETIRHNILYGKLGATEEEMKEACEAAQILDFIESLPEGFDTHVGERGLRLSGGEKQRVAIARCLLKNPPVVLLDEATSALDTRTEKMVQQALDTLTEYRTTLIIAHRLSTVKQANQIIVLSSGRVLEKGSHEELISTEDSEYSKMWKAQQAQGHKKTLLKKRAASTSGEF